MLRRYRMAGFLLILSIILSACVDPDPARRGADADVDVDAGADTDPMTCENVHERFNILMADNSHCEVDEDCASTEFTPWGYCECNPHLGDHPIPAYRRDIDEEVDAYFDFFRTSDCFDRTTDGGVCDVGPITETYCNDQGRCAARTDPGCLGGFY